jgi:hypothetical protein
VKGPTRSTTTFTNMRCTCKMYIFKGMCAAKTERMDPHRQSDKLLASGQEVRSTRRVDAPSGRCPE